MVGVAHRNHLISHHDKERPPKIMKGGKEMIPGTVLARLMLSVTPTSVGVSAVANPQDVDLVSLDIVTYPVGSHPPAVPSGLRYDYFSPCKRLLSDPPQRFEDSSLVLSVDLPQVLVETPGDD